MRSSFLIIITFSDILVVNLFHIFGFSECVQCVIIVVLRDEGLCEGDLHTDV